MHTNSAIKLRQAERKLTRRGKTRNQKRAVCQQHLDFGRQPGQVSSWVLKLGSFCGLQTFRTPVAWEKFGTQVDSWVIVAGGQGRFCRSFGPGG